MKNKQSSQVLKLFSGNYDVNRNSIQQLMHLSLVLSVCCYSRQDRHFLYRRCSDVKCNEVPKVLQHKIPKNTSGRRLR